MIAVGSINKRAWCGVAAVGMCWLVVCACVAPTVALGATEFGISKFTISATNEAGEPYTQAGGHPYELTTDIEFNTQEDSVTHKREPVQEVKDIDVDLPPGLLGNPEAAPRCSREEFIFAACPASTQVGIITVIRHPEGSVQIKKGGVFNIATEAGRPSELGVLLPGGFISLLTGRVRTGEGYGLAIDTAGVQQAGVQSIAVTFWGVPAEESHNEQRGGGCSELIIEECTLENGGQSSGDPRVPFLTLPMDCSAGPLTATLEADSWQEPGILNANGAPDIGDGHWKTATATMPAVSGCDALAFEPSLVAQPEGAGAGFSTGAGEPVGLHVDLGVPQTESPALSATPNVKNVSVTLPAGMVVSPSSANGLLACSDAQFALDSAAPGVCPPASQVGTVKVETPDLHLPLEGDVYLAEPHCDPCSPADAQAGRMVRLFVQAVAEGQAGVVVKLEGTGSINQQTGQITTTFKEDPQLPFNDFKLSLGGGPRATLANSRVCGPATTSADLTPWSSPFTPDATPSSTFEVTGCLGSQFNPTFTAGTTNNQAGAFSPFTLAFGRGDPDEPFSGLSMQLPAGLEGTLSNVSLCKEPQASQGTCGPESLIGHAQVLTGPGAEPFLVTGCQVFLTESYKGAPFGLSIVVPAKAGPYTLSGTTGQSTVVVREAIAVDPHTAALTITGEPLPTALDGIPLQLKAVNVTIDRQGFTFNPTSCNKMAITGTLTSSQGASAAESSSFQATNCAALHFKPKFAVTTSGKTSRAKGASLAVKLIYPNAPPGSEANIAKVKVDLPKQMPSRLTTLQKACTAAVFEANPAHCPAASVVGHAKAITPILPVPLEGPAYFVSHGGEAFPSLSVVLQGYGVTVDLVGTTFISKAGITSSAFKTVPDVPVGSFELTLPEGKFSALAANGNLCKSKLAMPTAFVGQNGVEIHQSTKIGVTGCSKAKTKKSKQKTKPKKKK
jgi:hypothetical protein